jgi:two-component system phosphate regulon sensor histidine kinase PhoR
MNPNGQRSLLFTLGLALLCVQLLLIIIAASWLWPQARRHAEQRALADATTLVAQLRPAYQNLLETADRDGDRSAVSAAVKRDAALLDARVTLFEGEDAVQLDSVETDPRFDRPWRRPEVALALEHGEACLLRADVVTNEPTVFAVTRLTDKGDSSVTLRLGRSMVDAYAWINRMAAALLLVAGALMAATAGALWLAAGRVRRRAESISWKMSELAEGNLRTRFAPSDDAEFAPITQSLNRLTACLSDHVEQLQSQQSMHQTILQSMGSAVIALDLEQRILDMNLASERMLGCAAEESRGRLLHEVVLNARLHRFVEESMHDASRPAIEFSIDPDGQTKIEVDSERLITADGRPRGLLIILSDVTRLRRLESLRSDFAANVSHELRTPITNIKGYVETLIDVGLDDKEQANRFLDVVNKNSNRLAAIIDDVMSLTKLEQPHTRETLDRSLRSVTNIVRSAVGQFERAAEAKRITIRSDVPEQLKVLVHAPLIEQAVGNLVSNAINYSPPNTVVTISARMKNGKVEVAVIDQGPGIAQQHLPRLFERFYRVDKARSREVGGTGLGLALVKHIALVHGGEVRIKSELGKGSEFTIILPGE